MGKGWRRLCGGGLELSLRFGEHKEAKASTSWGLCLGFDLVWFGWGKEKKEGISMEEEVIAIAVRFGGEEQEAGKEGDRGVDSKYNRCDSSASGCESNRSGTSLCSELVSYAAWGCFF